MSKIRLNRSGKDFFHGEVYTKPDPNIQTEIIKCDNAWVIGGKEYCCKEFAFKDWSCYDCDSPFNTDNFKFCPFCGKKL